LLAWAPSARAGAIPWCGSGEPTADLADAVSAFEWHVVYAMPSDGVNRFGSYAPRLAGDVATLSNWWLAQDSTRRPRFDLVEAPGCASEPYGRVDITLLRLPRPSSAYSFRELVADVRAAGFVSPDKGYLVYYDGTLHAGDEYGLCGQGSTDRRAWAYTFVYLQSCGQSFNDETRVTIATHEMLHGMGAVVSSAPHACDSGHVCDGSGDLMKSLLQPGDSLARLNLDLNRDDYYGHGGSWYDSQDSGLLYRLDQSLDPAPEIVNLTATSAAGVVRVDWSASASSAMNLFYRVYDDKGDVVRYDRSSTITAVGDLGQTFVWTIRSVTVGGFLSRPATLRFKVGYGIVDEAGALIRDTIPPADPQGIRLSRSGKTLVLRWAAVDDPIGLRGYLVTVAGKKAVTVKATSVRLVLASVRGKQISVAAVDQAGNRGAASTVRAPR
jgi:hypothetical protein